MDTSPTTAAGISIDQFSRGLTESGLMSADEVLSLTATIPPDQRRDCRPFAQELVKQQKLTKYQAAMLLQGKTKGLVLGNYELLDKLGQGGMGMVFKARHRRMGRIVALKVLAPSVTKNPRAVKRFQREAHAAAQLQHPNIVAAYDAGEDKGIHFLVMELVDGSDLSSLIKKQGPLPIGRAVDCIIQAARGIEHAHASGVIHRDIKPSNLLLARQAGPSGSGLVKVLDMGLARFDNGSNTATPEDLTQSGSIMGTCDYMAPEQAINSKYADQRSDIYSLGCTLYYLVTGKPMYGGETSMEKLLAHRETPIPPLPGASKTLQAVYQRMVAKEAQDRFASVRELVVALEACPEPSLPPGLGGPTLQGLPSSGRSDTSATQPWTDGDNRLPSRRPRRSLKLWLVLATGVLMVAGVGSVAIAVAVAKRSGPTVNTERSALVGSVETAKPVQGVDQAWIDAVAKLPAEKQLEAVIEELKKRNPGFEAGHVHFKQVGKNRVIALSLLSPALTDVSPLRALKGLDTLSCSGRKLADLSPLADLPLVHLNVTHSAVTDLRPLQRMPLKKLLIYGNKITNLWPIVGLPLQEIDCDYEPGRDDAALRSIKTLEKVNGKPIPEFWKGVVKEGPKTAGRPLAQASGRDAARTASGTR